MPLQIDGEPFNVAPAAEAAAGLEPFDVSIDLAGRAVMLARGGGGEGEGEGAFAAVEGALAKEELGTAQRDALLKGMSGGD